MPQNYLTAAEIEENASAIRNSSIGLLVRDWEEAKSIVADPRVWGDEIEYQLIRLDEKQERAFLALEQETILAPDVNESSSVERFEFQPEYTKYQVESTPQSPYTCLEDLLKVENSMKMRRQDLKDRLGDAADPYTLSMFPLLGTSADFTTPAFPVTSKNMTSSSIPDEIISTKTRYQTLETNLRERGGKPVEIRLPIFKDTKTPSPYIDPEAQQDASGSTDLIHMDGLIFGPGACGLQVTLQMKNLEEARKLHDQLCAVGPIMMALTASTPIYKGRLADVDARWQALSASLDDRKPSEEKHLPTRWSTSPMYIDSERTRKGPKSIYEPDAQIIARLENGGLDNTMAQYFGNLFLRNPVLVTKDDITTSDSPNMTKLDSRLSTSSWPHVRLKMPESSHQGWRLEFRTMEVQPTDFENAAGAVFIALLRYALAELDCDYCVSVDKLEQNMARAQARDAVNTQRFWWRVDDGTEHEVTCADIINGSGEASNPSFLPLGDLVEDFLSKSELSNAQREEIQRYVTFIRHRAAGKEATPAKWMRNLVLQHESYKDDSVVNDSMCYDLLKKVKDMNVR